MFALIRTHKQTSEIELYVLRVNTIVQCSIEYELLCNHKTYTF
jgi:hypothetical protein